MKIYVDILKIYLDVFRHGSVTLPPLSLSPALPRSPVPLRHFAVMPSNMQNNCSSPGFACSLFLITALFTSSFPFVTQLVSHPLHMTQPPFHSEPHLSLSSVTSSLANLSVTEKEALSSTFATLLASAQYPDPLPLPGNASKAQVIGTSLQQPPAYRCNFSIIYNKPPKTASTFIQGKFSSWARKNRRRVFTCTSQAFITNLILHECVPQTNDGCGVLNCHVVLSPPLLSFLRTRLPNARLITSTRYPPARILSLYLQIYNLRGSALKNTDGNERFRRWLKNSYSPWDLYNFHFGHNFPDRLVKKNATGTTCPLSKVETRSILEAISRYDIVIDMNLVEATTTILKHFGLFEIFDSEKRSNNRHSSLTLLDKESLQLLKNVSCVERVIHFGLQMRMASLYSKVSRKSCITAGRLPGFQYSKPAVKTCLASAERAALGEEWVF